MFAALMCVINYFSKLNIMGYSTMIISNSPFY